MAEIPYNIGYQYTYYLVMLKYFKLSMLQYNYSCKIRLWQHTFT